MRSSFVPIISLISKMVMTRSGEFEKRKLLKGSFNSKGKTFDKEESAIDPIVVEPLNSVLLAALVPYGSSKDEPLAS